MRPVRRNAFKILLGIAVAIGLTGASCAPAALPVPLAPSGGGSGTQWGQPTVENFDSLGGRWFVYDFPTTSPRRSRDLVSVSGGILKLRGATNAAGLDVGSGVSDNEFHQKYGRWEARFRVTSGAGFGVAILLWPENGRWPKDGEVDLVEVPSADRQRAVESIHNGPSNLHTTHGIVSDFTTWHTVAVDWLPSGLTYYVDGQATWNVNNPAYIPTTGQLHLTLQLDECAPTVYGGFIPCRTGGPSAGTVLEVDWVKVYAPPAGL